MKRETRYCRLKNEKIVIAVIPDDSRSDGVAGERCDLADAQCGEANCKYSVVRVVSTMLGGTASKGCDYTKWGLRSVLWSVRSNLLEQVQDLSWSLLRVWEKLLGHAAGKRPLERTVQQTVNDLVLAYAGVKGKRVSSLRGKGKIVHESLQHLWMRGEDAQSAVGPLVSLFHEPDVVIQVRLPLVPRMIGLISNFAASWQDRLRGDNEDTTNREVAGSDISAHHEILSALMRIGIPLSLAPETEDAILSRFSEELRPNAPQSVQRDASETRSLLCMVGGLRSLPIVLRQSLGDAYHTLKTDTMDLIQRVGVNEALPILHNVLTGENHDDVRYMYNVRLAAAMLAETGNMESASLLKQAVKRCQGDGEGDCAYETKKAIDTIMKRERPATGECQGGERRSIAAPEFQ